MLYVVAFGDGVLDIDMLKKADEAFVAVIDKKERSKSVEATLRDGFQKHGLKAHQVLLPSTVSPRLNTKMLPIMSLTDDKFLNSLLWRGGNFEVIHATDSILAALLQTPMRDARHSRPGLREAHRQAGWYLAVELVSSFVGLEERAIQHVQNKSAHGH